MEPDARVDMMFAIDISGSMCPYINAWVGGMSNYVTDFQDTEHWFGATVYGVGSTSEALVWTFPSLVDVVQFISAVATINCNGSGIEPTYDVIDQLTNSTDPLSIGWRPDATPYIIVVTDEQPQTRLGQSEFSVAPQTFNCEIGNCVPGDQVEIYIITKPTYFYRYDSIVFNDSDRLINISPADENRYTQVLKGVFQNICLY